MFTRVQVSGQTPATPFVVGVIVMALLMMSVAVPVGFTQGLVTEPMRVGVILPEISGAGDVESLLKDALSESALKGITMATEETDLNASMLGMDFDSIVVSVPDAAAAEEAVAKLVAEEDIYALVGGIGEGFARALSEAAQRHNVVFFNIGSPDDALRGEVCYRNTFHLEASSAMYLDAMSGWFVRAPHRRWFLVYDDSPGGEALYRRTQKSLTERHFGAREVGRASVKAGQDDFTSVMNSIRRANPDLVVVLLGAVDQLKFLDQYDAAGIDVRITGFPAPETQTRRFYQMLAERAPGADAGYRSSLWEPNLESYGARELNARFMSRWDEPMDSPAWAAYSAIKILFETVMFGGVLEAEAIVAYLESPTTVFDVWKGIGTSFRTWDHQLRQSLFLVRVDQGKSVGEGVREQLALARLVGELPAIYMPGTDPVERLDQLGDLAGETSCIF